VFTNANLDTSSIRALFVANIQKKTQSLLEAGTQFKLHFIKIKVNIVRRAAH
jgi:hypothetical protein